MVFENWTEPLIEFNSVYEPWTSILVIINANNEIGLNLSSVVQFPFLLWLSRAFFLFFLVFDEVKSPCTLHVSLFLIQCCRSWSWNTSMIFEGFWLEIFCYGNGNIPTTTTLLQALQRLCARPWVCSRASTTNWRNLYLFRRQLHCEVFYPCNFDIIMVLITIW